MIALPEGTPIGFRYDDERSNNMRRFVLAGLVSLAAIGAVQLSALETAAAPPRCDLVDCFPCPEGTVLAPTGKDCCRCGAV